MTPIYPSPSCQFFCNLACKYHRHIYKRRSLHLVNCLHCADQGQHDTYSARGEFNNTSHRKLCFGLFLRSFVGEKQKCRNILLKNLPRLFSVLCSPGGFLAAFDELVVSYQLCLHPASCVCNTQCAAHRNSFGDKLCMQVCLSVCCMLGFLSFKTPLISIVCCRMQQGKTHCEIPHRSVIFSSFINKSPSLLLQLQLFSLFLQILRHLEEPVSRSIAPTISERN